MPLIDPVPDKIEQDKRQCQRQKKMNDGATNVSDNAQYPE
jgi:hypothetical protein